MTPDDLADTRCRTVTIDDAPANEDAFDSHQPIADAVYEIVTTEDGGRTIGLEGGWGSGKSTVVKLLTEHPNRSKDEYDTHVFLFDAWSHQGDPLRRSFLEKLLTSLADKTWVRADAWEKKLKALATRRHDEHIRPTTKLGPATSVGGTAIALLLAGLPIAADLPRWLGLLMYCCVFVLVMAIAMLHTRPQRSNDETDAWLLDPLSKGSNTGYRSVRIETPDPTSIEFEGRFRELMTDALERWPNRRLVIVVDNLDRVEAEDARAIWATLQTFLHHPHEEREPWLKSLWIVMPYDRSGIARLWDRPNVEPPDRARTKRLLGVSTPNGDKDPTKSFIDKSIQVRFEVPPLLLTDWRGFLKSELQAALPECPEADELTAYRLYQIKKGPLGAPTPRELKQYVNRIGALHRRWQHDLDFASLVYYASLNAPADDVIQWLRNGNSGGAPFPSLIVRDLLPKDVEGELAAIAFGAAPGRASQLLLGPPIEKALQSKTSDALVSLLDRPAAWDVLLQIVQEQMELQQALTVSACLMGVSDSQRQGREREWQEVALHCARHARATKNWPALSSELAENLRPLLNLVGEEAALYIARLATAPEIRADGGAAWAEGAHRLLSQLEQLEVVASGAPADICAVLTQFERITGWKVLAGRLSIDPGARIELDAALIERLGEDPSEVAGALTVLSHVEPDLNWTPFVEASTRRLKDGAPSQGRTLQPSPEESRSLLDILWHAGEHGEQDRANLFEQGIAFEYVWHAHEQEVNEALGEWISEVLRYFSPDTWGTQSLGAYAPNGKQLVDSMIQDPSTGPVDPLANAIERTCEFDLIDLLGRYAESAELATGLIGRLWTSKDFREGINSERFWVLWPHFARAKTANWFIIEDFVQSLFTRYSFKTKVQEHDFDVDRLDMYEALIRSQPNEEEARALAEWVAESLSDFVVERWQEVMAKSDDWVSLLTAIRGIAPEARIRGHFSRALRSFLERIVNGDTVTDCAVDRWPLMVVSLLDTSGKRSYEQGVIGVATSSAARLPEQFFDLAGDTLEEPRVFTRTEILDRLLPDLVTEKNTAGLSWLIDALKDEGLRGSVPEGGLGALKEAVRVRLRQAPSDNQELDQKIQELALLLGIEEPSGPDHG